MPVAQKAPSEAETQCAELARGGKVFSLPLMIDHQATRPKAQVYASGSEDMDVLTFNTLILY